MKSCLLYFSLFFLIDATHSQGQIESINVTSPDVASFNKFIEKPINRYAGTPDISIPLYTLKDGMIELPFTVRYNSSGIKVKEEASWVGLGWNLNVGGVITQVVVGQPDHHDRYFDSFMSDGFFVNTHGIDLEESWVGGFFDLAYDEDAFNKLYCVIAGHAACNEHLGKLKPDVFNFSYPGNAGKFIIDYLNNGKALILSKEHNLEVNVHFSDNEITGFDIVDSGITHSFDSPAEMSVPGRVSTVSYRLSSSTYPNGQVINYHYTEVEVNSPVSTEMYVMPHDGSPYYHSGRIPTIQKQLYSFWGTEAQLDYIETTNFTVDFITEARIDIENSKRLQAISFTSNLPSDYSVQIDFSYSYFISSNPSQQYVWNISRWPTGSTYATHRLKLDSVTRSVNSLGLEKHKMYYDNTPLPRKDSYYIDYWGYYNGIKLNTTLIPDLYKLNYVYVNNLSIGGTSSIVLSKSYQLNQFTQPNKADRSANFIYAKAGSLIGIEYPTGGYTEYEYESHTFNEIGVFKEDLRKPDYYIPSDGEIGSGTYRRTASDYNIGGDDSRFVDFELTTQTDVDVRVEFDRGERTWEEILELPYVIEITQLTGTGGGVSFNDFEPVDGQSQVKNYTRSLSPGTYQLEVDHPPTSYPHGFIRATISFTVSNPPKPTFSSGSGIRIKQIRHYDEKDDSSPSLSYDYDYSDGVLFDYPEFAQEQSVTYKFVDDQGQSRFHSPLRLYQTFGSSLISNPYGRNLGLGYTYVTERVHGTNAAGYTVYRFFNDPVYHREHENISEIFDETADQYPVRNGKVKSITHYDLYDQVISKEEHEYKVVPSGRVIHVNVLDNYNTFFSILESDGIPSAYNYFDENDATVNVQEIFSYDIVMEHKESELDRVITAENFEYNGQLQLSNHQKTSSDGGTESQSYRYAEDISTGVYSGMAALNMNNPVEVIAKRNNLVTGSSLTLYKEDFAGKYIPASGFKALVETPLNSFFEFDGASKDGVYPADPEIEFLRYDSRSNILEYKERNKLFYSIYWGYNNTFPVAIFQNMTYPGIESQPMLINDLNKLDDYLQIDDSNRASFEALNDNIRHIVENNFGGEVFVETFTYDPMIGLTSETDQNGLTTYYEYDDFGRLKSIKDQDGNILKHYQYNYKN